MGRRTSEKEIKNLIEKIRNAGDVAIRSTFIVGFPGETDEQFQKLYDFIGEYKLNYAGFLRTARKTAPPQRNSKTRFRKRSKTNALKTSLRFKAK